MKTNKREILIYYHPRSNAHKKTIAFAQSLSKHVKTYEFSQAPSTTSSWKMIINTLGIDPRNLLDKSREYYQEHIRGRDFDEEDWVNVIKRNPDLIKAPIAIRGNKAVLCLNSTDIYKLMEPSERDGRFPEAKQ